MNTIRAKFSCWTIESDGGNEQVLLQAVYGTDDKDNKENNQFSEATPCGSVEMQIDNKEAQGFFVEGKEYYLDFSRAN